MIHHLVVAVIAVFVLAAAWYVVQEVARRVAGKPPDCDLLAESDCRNCSLHEACGIRHNEQTGEPACRLN